MFIFSAFAFAALDNSRIRTVGFKVLWRLQEDCSCCSEDNMSELVASMGPGSSRAAPKTLIKRLRGFVVYFFFLFSGPLRARRFMLEHAFIIAQNEISTISTLEKMIVGCRIVGKYRMSISGKKKKIIDYVAMGDRQPTGNKNQSIYCLNLTYVSVPLNCVSYWRIILYFPPNPISSAKKPPPIVEFSMCSIQ